MKVISRTAIHLLLTVSMIFGGWVIPSTYAQTQTQSIEPIQEPIPEPIQEPAPTPIQTPTPTPTPVIAETQAEFEARVTAELTAFAETHSQAELETEVYRRLFDAQTAELSTPVANIYRFPIGDDYGMCINNRQGACREDYDRDLYLATAASFTVTGGCLAASAGVGSVLCVAFALGAQRLGFAAARSGQRGCNIRGDQDCRNEYR